MRMIRGGFKADGLLGHMTRRASRLLLSILIFAYCASLQRGVGYLCRRPVKFVDLNWQETPQ